MTLPIDGSRASGGPQDRPADPVAAATHPDPYPYYATLAAERPLYRDERLGLWVASSAAAVTAVLASDICRVRPPSEPIPKAIAGSPAGEIFRHLVRMNDGANHCPFKQAIVGTLSGLEMVRVSILAHEQAHALGAALAPERDRDSLTRFIFALPTYVLASLLGVPAERLEDVAAWTNSFVLSFSPIADAAQAEEGKTAAAYLLALFGDLFDAQETQREKGAPETLLGVLAQRARHVGRNDRDVIIANGAGFLSQAYEATAGLIGNTLLALAVHEDIRAAVHVKPDLLGKVVQEVLRYDPPVHSTRRFVAQTGLVAGEPMSEGDAILVLLAAATRDPAHADPHRFDLARADRRIYDFGSGAHTCPADRIAPLIAEIAVAHLLDAGIDLKDLRSSTTYRRSVAVHVPLFGTPG
jgi:cytochrome P450